MELSELNQDERVALVGLMKLVVMSDGEVSEEELEHVEMLVGEFGDDGYQEALDQFETRFADEPAFSKFLASRHQPPGCAGPDLRDRPRRGAKRGPWTTRRPASSTGCRAPGT